MAAILQLDEAIREFVRDGDVVALEGFTHLIPFAAGHEIIRQQRRNLTVIRMTPDVIYDQLIGAGCVSKIVFSWGGNPGVGSLHRLRDAIEKQWPNPLTVEEHEHAGMAAAYAAGASHLPFGVLRGYIGTDLPKHNPKVKFIDCPFTGETLAAVPAHRPDVTVIHAQKADRKGNVMMWGVVGAQKEAVMAAKRSIVTVEEIVDDLKAPPKFRHPAFVGGECGERGTGRGVPFLRAGAILRGTMRFTNSGTTWQKERDIFSRLDRPPHYQHERFFRVQEEPGRMLL